MKLRNLDDVDITIGLFREADNDLSRSQTDLDKAVGKLTAAAERKMKPVVAHLAKYKLQIERFIASNKDRLFSARERSIKLVNGVIGIRKSEDSLEIENPDKTVLLIRRYFPDRAAQAIKVTEIPLKTIIKSWEDWELDKIDVSRKENGSEPYFKPSTTDAKARAQNSKK